MWLFDEVGGYEEVVHLEVDPVVNLRSLMVVWKGQWLEYVGLAKVSVSVLANEIPMPLGLREDQVCRGQRLSMQPEKNVQA